MGAVQADEAGRGDRRAVRQAVGLPLVQLYVFPSARADGLDEPTTGSQLCDQRLRYLGEGRADDDSVIRCTVRHTEGSLAEDDRGVLDALRGESAAGLLDQIRPAFDADHIRGEAGQQHGLPAVPVPISRTRSLPVRPSADTIMATSEGWVVTWSWGRGTGVSR